MGWFDSEIGSRVRTGATLYLLVGVFLALATYTCFGRTLLLCLSLLVVALAAFEYASLVTAVEVARGMVDRVIFFTLTFLPAGFVGYSKFAANLCGVGAEALPQFLVIFVCSLAMMFVGSFLYLIFKGRETLELALNFAVDLFIGSVLIGLGGGALVMLSVSFHGATLLFWLIMVVSINDTAAYFGGKRYGARKLALAISPNKTVEGAFFGFLAGVLAGSLLRIFLPYYINFFGSVLLALVVVSCAQVGDLSKSLIKRVYRVKDSGKLLPGHGGILDRVDGLLMAAPVIFLFLLFNEFFY
ncbi:MAG TPA: phosphatidate cytidylyltransferase [Oligoflexia bacterium]|nr:phosphatidate cytidylyltransferase [Oligoflexia bacterium]HMP27778.1 phosphatidate cytidylyltransferase [Oligoflexia bacterium]